MPAGRPPKYGKQMLGAARKMYFAGATDAHVAAILGITTETIFAWSRRHKEFSDARKKGKAFADGNVVTSLYRRAMGYEVEESKVVNDNSGVSTTKTTKHITPDTVAMIYWLKNRDPANWRDRVDVTSGDKPINTVPTIVVASEATKEKLNQIR